MGFFLLFFLSLFFNKNVQILFNQKIQIIYFFFNSNPLDLNSNSAQKYTNNLPNTVNLPRFDKYFFKVHQTVSY